MTDTTAIPTAAPIAAIPVTVTTPDVAVEAAGSLKVQTIKQARDFVARGRVDGVYCPCCNKFVKAYRRKLNPTMAAGLVWLVKHIETNKIEFAHVPSSAPRRVVRSNQLSTLKHWGLVENVPGAKDKDGIASAESGGWKPTLLGIEFAHNRAKVPSHVIIADDQTVNEAAGGEFNIIAALGKKYDYQTLIDHQG